MGEVREPDDVEHEAVDPVARERLRRHLDADGAHVDLAHAGEQRVQFARLGRRQRARDGLVADAALGRRREPRDDARAGAGCRRAGRRRWSCRWCRSRRTAWPGCRRCDGSTRPPRRARPARRASTRTGRPASAASSAPAASVSTATAPASRAAAANDAPWALRPGTPTYRSPGRTARRREHHAGHLEVVDVAVHLEVERLGQAVERSRARMLRPEGRGRRSGHEPNFLTRWLAARAPGRRMERSDTSSAPGSSPVGRRERMRRTSSS